MERFKSARPIGEGEVLIECCLVGSDASYGCAVVVIVVLLSSARNTAGIDHHFSCQHCCNDANKSNNTSSLQSTTQHTIQHNNNTIKVRNNFGEAMCFAFLEVGGKS